MDLVWEGGCVEAWKRGRIDKVVGVWPTGTWEAASFGCELGTHGASWWKGRSGDGCDMKTVKASLDQQSVLDTQGCAFNNEREKRRRKCERQVAAQPGLFQRGRAQPKGS
jgi:hypothetical protein